MRIHLLAAGDIIASIGTRTHLGQFVVELQRQNIGLMFSFFQFRTENVPRSSSDGYISVDDFPYPVYCPTDPEMYDSLPRPLFRLYERILLWLFFCQRIRRITPAEKLILHGCLGAAHFCSHKKVSADKKWWLKFSLIEEEKKRGFIFQVRKKIERLNSLQFGKRIVVNKQMSNFLRRECGPPHLDDFVLPCLVDLDKFSPTIDRMTARQKMGFDERVVFLYLGIDAAWQCPEETIGFFKKIHRQLPASFLWILTPDQSRFRALVAEIPDEDHRIEYCPHENLADRIQAADFGFLLRKNNLINRVASPVKFPEYLAGGLSVIIGTGVGDYTALVRQKKLGVIVDPELPRTWDNAIAELMRFADNRDESRARSLEVARSLSWKSYDERIRREFKK